MLYNSNMETKNSGTSGTIKIIRNGNTFRLIFDVPQRYEVREYAKSARTSYTVLEPVHTPPLAVEVGQETARQIMAEAVERNAAEIEVAVPRQEWTAFLFLNRFVESV